MPLFSGWTRTLHEISIFHHSGSPPSVKALGLLRSALSEPYPPGRGSAPLQFNLDVVEAPPNSDQLRTIMSYLPSKNSSSSPSAASVFLSAHPSAASSDGANLAVVESLGRDKPNTFKWPVVVDWNAGKASVGDVDGVKGILELLRQNRDGETPKE
ncbi:thioredoxin-like protein [Mycena alexandri]|uniref:Thioredoxin-like protein n=1 Tax=Mycena alexandri TaxID=1745969 RepID=A0AAD6X6K9_9AGAR|nr:thioredoxin-like protein [Mycena alexandri]